MNDISNEARDMLANRLRDCKRIDRDLDARVAVALYSDTNHADSRENTYARLPSKSDECAPGTYWVSAFSGLSLRTAPGFTGDKLLQDLATNAIARSTPQHGDDVVERAVNGIVDDINRAGGIYGLAKMANGASRLRAILHLRIAALSALPSRVGRSLHHVNVAPQ